MIETSGKADSIHSIRKPLRNPEKPCSGSPSSERRAEPLRIPRAVAGLRSVFREP